MPKTTIQKIFRANLTNLITYKLNYDCSYVYIKQKFFLYQLAISLEKHN